MRKTLNLDSIEQLTLFNALKKQSFLIQQEMNRMDEKAIDGNEDAMQYANYCAKQVNACHSMLNKLGFQEG